MYVKWLQDISWRKHWYLILQMMKIVSIRAPSSFASLTLLEKVELWNWKRAKPFPIFLLCNEVEINMKYDIKNCCVVNWSLRLFVRPWYFWHKVYTFSFSSWEPIKMQNIYNKVSPKEIKEHIEYCLQTFS